MFNYGEEIPNCSVTTIIPDKYKEAYIKGAVPEEIRDRFFEQYVTIGRSAAVADISGFKFSGFLAWITWLFTHIFFLIGFRNKFIVIFQWMLAYLTYHSYSRLITYPWKPLKWGLPDKQLPPYTGCPCDIKDKVTEINLDK